jgi:hypothetical protein
MLAKAPKDRPSKMADLAASLKKVLKDLPEPDLSRYVRGSSNNLKNGATQDDTSPAPAIVPMKRPETSTSRDAAPASVPFPYFRRDALTTRAPYQQQRLPQWRVWLSGAAVACVLTVFFSSFFWNNG